MKKSDTPEASFNDQVNQWKKAAPKGEGLIRWFSATDIKNAHRKKKAALVLVGRNLTDLPDCISQMESVKVLNIAVNNFTTLPALPPNLTDLVAYGCVLNGLPELPEGTESICVHTNNLTELPQLPPGIQSVVASNNILSTLPRLPPGLKMLYVDNQRHGLSMAPFTTDFRGDDLRV